MAWPSRSSKKNGRAGLVKEKELSRLPSDVCVSDVTGTVIHDVISATDFISAVPDIRDGPITVRFDATTHTQPPINQARHKGRRDGVATPYLSVYVSAHTNTQAIRSPTIKRHFTVAHEYKACGCEIFFRNTTKRIRSRCTPWDTLYHSLYAIILVA